ELHRRRGRDRAERIVERDRDVIGVRYRGDLLAFHDAADMDDVGLQYVDFVSFKKPGKGGAAGAALAGREPRLDVAADHRERGGVLGVARLFEPEQIAGLELARDGDGRAG